MRLGIGRLAPSPLLRIALGVTALAVMTLMLLDFALGLVDDPAARERESRKAFSELLTVQAGRLAARDDAEGVSVLLADALQRRPGLRSAAVARVDGSPVAIAGPHAQGWAGAATGPRSTSTHVRVPLNAPDGRWGEMQLVFDPIAGDGWPGVLATQRAWWPLACFAVLIVVLRLYLGQVMRAFDPATGVPDRVRHAYDALAEGIVLLDAHGRVVLTNAAFRQLAGGQDAAAGHALEASPWFVAGLEAPPEWPWHAALRTGQPGEGRPVVVHWGGQRRHLVVSCSPVLDDARQARGCLVVFLDRTSIERANEDLRRAVDTLHEAKRHIESQNAELVRLATRDPLSGCLNRRAFFEQAGAALQRLRHDGRPYAVVMCDIDHFKQFNDRHGHQTGDAVIQAVARLLGESVRAQDLVCRYGGEEFCILVPDSDESYALDIAERLRSTVEVRAGASVTTPPGLVVRSSFGVAVARADEPVDAAIDRADQALYASKRAGRNRVTLHDPWAVGADAAMA